MAVQSTNPYHYSFNVCAGSSQQNARPEFGGRGRGRGRGRFQYNDYSHYNLTPSHGEFHCDNCDRSFKDDAQFKQHQSEHTVCGKEGCRFTAHPKVVAIHIRTQHDTGLFRKINNLKNPEEVAKWIAERKRRYPTRHNIETKSKLEEDKETRGERIRPDNSRFNKDMRAGRRGRQGRYDRGSNNQQRPRYSNGGGQDGGSNSQQGRSRMQKRNRTRRKPFGDSDKPLGTQTEAEQEDINGGVQRFKGTGFLYEENNDDKEESAAPTASTEPAASWAISDDEEDQVREEQPTVPAAPSKPETPTVSRSLGLLMASYGSDASDDEPDPPKAVANKPEVAKHAATTESDDDGPPIEVKTIKCTEPLRENDPVEAQKRPLPLNNEETQPKRFKSGHRHQQFSGNQVQERFVRRRRPTLLEKLLSKEIIHERNTILQCVRHIVNNHFFDKIEVIEIKEDPLDKVKVKEEPVDGKGEIQESLLEVQEE